jgi:hypothetical protein
MTYIDDDKIRRRLAPFLAEQKITEPTISMAHAFDDSPSRIVVSVAPRGRENLRLQEELTAALADLGEGVVVELSQSA